MGLKNVLRKVMSEKMMVGTMGTTMAMIMMVVVIMMLLMVVIIR